MNAWPEFSDNTTQDLLLKCVCDAEYLPFQRELVNVSRQPQVRPYGWTVAQLQLVQLPFFVSVSKPAASGTPAPTPSPLPGDIIMLINQRQWHSNASPMLLPPLVDSPPVRQRDALN